MTEPAYRVSLPDLTFFQQSVPCQFACPVRTDARGYVSAIARGEYERAYLIARETNPFASTCGWVCGAPCEAACRRGKIDTPIAIRALKRFVDDRYGVYLGETGEPRQPPAFPGYVGPTNRFDLGNATLPTARTELNAARQRGERTGKRVAVIGAGTAGLTCAHDLALLGHEVTIFDSAPVAGGYPALTAFCRRAGIGQPEKIPAGRYDFEPGEEMQHDTSPHELVLGGKARRVQTASLVLGYSRMLFFQFYPRFTRFECKVFLAEAMSYMGGACAACMIDNTHVVVLSGTGAEMTPVPEMVAFGERYGFAFRAHEKGDANRSARVERPFAFIEGNFLAGRTFDGVVDMVAYEGRDVTRAIDALAGRVGHYLLVSTGQVYLVRDESPPGARRF